MVKQKIQVQPWHALVLLIVVNLVIGFTFGNQYGQTWDEPSFYLYGERSYDAFMRGLAGQPLIPEKHIFFLDLRYYGPVYAALGWKIVDWLLPNLTGWGYMDVWHFVNFSFFQLTLIMLYLLAKRFVPPWWAFFTILLFSTQPLIFGHAFINPKDIPFMTMFLGSVSLGLYLVDAIKRREDLSSQNSMPWFATLAAILFTLFIFTFVGKDLIYRAVEWAITAIYNAPADSFLGSVFSTLSGTSNRLPVENYIRKASNAHLERLAIYFLAVLLLGRKIYVDYKVNKKFTSPFQVDLKLCLWILVASVMLGLATSIRLLAPFSGLLIALFALREKGRDAIPVLLAYFSVVAVVCMITWPFLWDSPASNFFEAFRVMRDFPFAAEVRFMGGNVSAANLPWYYLPVLISIQLTEPLVIFSVVGLLVAAFSWRSSGFRKYAILLAWFFVPIALQIGLGSNAYDNFRQFLFVLPPLFVLSGVGLYEATKRIRHSAWKFVVCLVCLAPGVWGLFSLHPVQYIYYNLFVGGVAGAEGNFELDYWLTSYRLAAPYINENASAKSNILAWGSVYNGAREDQDVYAFMADSDLENSPVTFEYAVISTRFASHLAVLKDAPVVYEVRKGGALLAVVKKLTP